jgi:hypothetical protein
MRALVTDGLDEFLELPVDHGPFSDLFLQLEHDGLMDVPGPMGLKVESAAARGDPGISLADPGAWSSVEQLRVFAGPATWYRFTPARPFRRVRLSLTGGQGGVRILRLIALSPQRPAGTARARALRLTLSRFDGDRATLLAGSARPVVVPREMLPDGPPVVSAEVAREGDTTLLRRRPGGDLEVVALGGAFTGRSQLFSLQKERRLRALDMHLGGGAGEWVDGIGSWTLLQDWHEPRPVHGVLDAGSKSFATLYSDGRILVSSGQGRSVFVLKDRTDIPRLFHSTFGPDSPRLHAFLQQAVLPELGSRGDPSPVAPGSMFDLAPGRAAHDAEVESPQSVRKLGITAVTPGELIVWFGVKFAGPCGMDCERTAAIPRALVPDLRDPRPGQQLRLWRVR